MISSEYTEKDWVWWLKVRHYHWFPLIEFSQDDPTAHDQFLRINRAYEVLKDEDLCKKYDMHGEEGLKEDGPTGRGYQSWNFYRNDFGKGWWDSMHLRTLQGLYTLLG